MNQPPSSATAFNFPLDQRGDSNQCFEHNGSSASNGATLTPQSVCTRAAAAKDLGSRCLYPQRLPRHSHPAATNRFCFVLAALCP